MQTQRSLQSHDAHLPLDLIRDLEGLFVVLQCKGYLILINDLRAFGKQLNFIKNNVFNISDYHTLGKIYFFDVI